MIKEGIEIIEKNRFSIFQNNKQDLDSWVRWFKARGIPCVVSRNKASNRYALYRHGLIEHKEANDVSRG